MIYGWAVWPIVVSAAIVVVWRGRRGGASAAQSAARVALVVYLGWLVGAALFPVPLHGAAAAGGDDANRARGVLAAVNLVPLRIIRETIGLGWGWPAVRLLAGNVLVFVPFGALAPMVWPRLRTWAGMTLAALAFSAAVELAQLAVSLALGFAYRSTDIDDLLLNVPGVLLGFALCRLLERRSEAAGRARA